MLNHCLSWSKFVNTHLYYSRQLFYIHLFHRRTTPQRCILFVAPLGTAISRLSGPVRLSVRYTTPDIYCRDRRYECDGGIRWGGHFFPCMCQNFFLLTSYNGTNIFKSNWYFPGSQMYCHLFSNHSVLVADGLIRRCHSCCWLSMTPKSKEDIVQMVHLHWRRLSEEIH